MSETTLGSYAQRVPCSTSMLCDELDATGAALDTHLRLWKRQAGNRNFGDR